MWGQIAAAALGAYSSSKARGAANDQAASTRGAADLAWDRSQPWDVSGMFGGATFDSEGNTLGYNLSEPWQAEYDYALSDAAKQREYISAMEADPMAAGQKFYEMQKALYAPDQEKDRLDLEKRLLGQGMLGSSGGAARQEALRKAQAQVDLQAQYAGYDKAQGMIDTYRGRSTDGLTSAQSIGKLPEGYGETGMQMGKYLSEPAYKTADMYSGAAGTEAAATGKYYKGITNAIGSLF